MRACRDLPGPRRFLLVEDSKLVSYGNLRDMIDAGVEFIAPASKIYVRADELAALDRAAATEVDYVAARDARVPAAGRGRWAVCEDTMTIRGKRTRDPVLVLRRVFVHSGARGAAAATRAPRSSTGPATIWTGWAAGSAAGTTPTSPRSPPGSPRSPDRQVGAYLRTEVGTDPAPGNRPRLVVRPGRAGRRGRHRRLARPAHQPARHHHPSRMIPDKGHG